MYYQIFDIHNEPIGKIVANNDNDARFITRQLYPHYAAIHEISHKKFHHRPNPIIRLMDYITSLSPFAQAIIALIITTILFLFLDSDASASLPAMGLGLDQWLHKKTYVKNWDHMKPEERHTVTVTGPAANQINLSKVSNIEEELMYWRKANMIHAFFMKDEDADNCQDVYVSSKMLQDLHSRCARIIAECPLEDGIINNGKSLVNGEWVHNTEPGKVLTNVKLAEELLPTQSGFFFGSTDFDEYYMQDITETHAMLEELFKNPNWTRADYYYSSSW